MQAFYSNETMVDDVWPTYKSGAGTRFRIICSISSRCLWK